MGIEPSRSASGAATLPPEILLQIFSHLGGRDRARASGVCAQWYACANDDPGWRALYARERLVPRLAPQGMPRQPPAEVESWRGWYDMHERIGLAADRAEALERSEWRLRRELDAPTVFSEAVLSAAGAFGYAGLCTLGAVLAAPVGAVAGGLCVVGGALMGVATGAAGAACIGLGLVTVVGIRHLVPAGFCIADRGLLRGTGLVLLGGAIGVGGTVVSVGAAVMAGALGATGVARSTYALLTSPTVVLRVMQRARLAPELQRITASHERLSREVQDARGNLERVRQKWLTPGDTPTAEHP
jgi:hypothetical protein